MKIGQIAHIYKPHKGGIENYVHRMTMYLRNRGHEVTVYTTNLSLREGGEKERDVVYSKSDFVLLRNPFSFELARRLAASNADIYHIHSPWFFSSLIAAKVLKGKPKVMTVHSAEIKNKNSVMTVLNTLYHPLAQYALGSMDIVMPQGETEKLRLLKIFELDAASIIPIPNGIDIQRFQKKDSIISEFGTKYGLRSDSFKILYVSRLVPEKSPQKLILAATQYLKEENVEVILIGGGTEGQIRQLTAISDDKIHILGEVSQEELVAAYHCADLFVFLGLWEGMPTVILEAMACGLPILTTPVAAIPDVVTEGQNGFFIDIPIEQKALAERILDLMHNVDLPTIGHINGIKIRQKYSWDVVGNQIMNLYERVLESRRK